MTERLQHKLNQLDWVAEASVRLRQEGDVVSGEAFVVPKDEHNLLDRLKQASDLLKNIDWRIYEVVVVPVHSLKQE